MNGAVSPCYGDFCAVDELDAVAGGFGAGFGKPARVVVVGEASRRQPFCATACTSCVGVSAPSEMVEWVWRSIILHTRFQAAVIVFTLSIKLLLFTAGIRFFMMARLNF